MTEAADAIVIGAGHNGLVCATYLARGGLRVTCVDAGEAAGGMAAPAEFGEGYRSPGLAHFASPVSAALRRDLELERFGYRPGPAAPTVMLDEGGRHVVLEAAQVGGDDLPAADADDYPAFREEYLGFARALSGLFENAPPRLKHLPFADKARLARLGAKLRFGLGRAGLRELLRVAGMNVFDVLNERFADERLKSGLALDAVLGSAMGPRTPGTVLTWLARLHAELNGPPSLQTAGEGSLVNALTAAATSAGVTLRPGARVERIDMDGERAAGVTLADGETLRGGLVVSATDPRATFARLVGPRHLDAMFAHRASQVRGQGVVARVNLALSGEPAFTGLDGREGGQRLVVAPSMRYIERAFNRSKYGEFPDEPVLEVTVPSVHDASLAPEGHHVVSVNVAYVPYRLEGGWQGRERELAERVIALLARFAPGLDSLVVHHELLTPAEIERRHGAVQGHWHHGELSMHQSFMLRPLHGAAQYATPVPGLYLCSAGCHPGGGLTGLPGRNAARRILEDRRAGR